VITWPNPRFNFVLYTYMWVVYNTKIYTCITGLRISWIRAGNAKNHKFLWPTRPDYCPRRIRRIIPSYDHQHCEIRKSEPTYRSVRLYNIIIANNCSADTAALRCAAPATAIETTHERICLLYYNIIIIGWG